MWNHGYHEIAEIAEKLGVSVSFVMIEVEQEHLRFTLTLYGEPQFFCRDLIRWCERRAHAILVARNELRAFVEQETSRCSG